MASFDKFEHHRHLAPAPRLAGGRPICDVEAPCPQILFLEEPPYVILGMPDPITGRCSANRGVLCRIAPEKAIEG